MKTKVIFGVALALGLIQPLCEADDMFQISWSGTVNYYDDTGRMVTRSYSARDVVRTIADNNGLNPNDLVLVYRPNAYDTAVVFRTAAGMARAGAGGQVVADYLQLPDITKVNTIWMTDVKAGTQAVRQAFLFDEHTNPIGSIFGRETQRRNATDNSIIFESFHGTFQFSIPDDGTHSVARPGVYSGTFATGARIKDLSAP